MSIEKIWAREILDSRGNPTVEVDLHTARGTERDLDQNTAPQPPPQPHPPLLGLPKPGMGSFLDYHQGWGAGPGSQPGLWGLGPVVQGARIHRPPCSSSVREACPASACL